MVGRPEIIVGPVDLSNHVAHLSRGRLDEEVALPFSSPFTQTMRNPSRSSRGLHASHLFGDETVADGGVCQVLLGLSIG